MLRAAWIGAFGKLKFPAPAPAPAPAPPPHPDGTINLKVVAIGPSAEIYFECQWAAPLQMLMDACCQQQGVSMNRARFLHDGNRIGPQSTPQDFNMEDGDIIDFLVSPV